MWGWNNSGIVGNGESNEDGGWGGLIQKTPVKVLDNVSAISCGAAQVPGGSQAPGTSQTPNDAETPDDTSNLVPVVAVTAVAAGGGGAGLALVLTRIRRR